MVECWSENPEQRPDFTTIAKKLKSLRRGIKTNIMDQMIEMLEKYSNNLEVQFLKLDPEIIQINKRVFSKKYPRKL